MLTNVPGIRIHITIDAMLWALEEFYLSMLGINIAVGERTAWPAAFPQRLLVIDEFGTFAGMAARDHRRHGHAGPPPALDQRRQLEWQGRQAGHRLLVAVHQPNLRLFEDSDSRAQYGYRLITGAYSTSLWRMTFGYAPPVEWDARVKGPGRGRHRGSPEPDPPRPDRPPAPRRAPPLRPHRAAAPRLARQRAARPVDQRPRDCRRPETRRDQHHHCPRCPCPTRTAQTLTSANTVRRPTLGRRCGTTRNPGARRRK